MDGTSPCDVVLSLEVLGNEDGLMRWNTKNVIGSCGSCMCQEVLAMLGSYEHKGGGFLKKGSSHLPNLHAICSLHQRYQSPDADLVWSF